MRCGRLARFKTGVTLCHCSVSRTRSLGDEWKGEEHLVVYDRHIHAHTMKSSVSRCLDNLCQPGSISGVLAHNWGTDRLRNSLLPACLDPVRAHSRIQTSPFFCPDMMIYDSIATITSSNVNWVLITSFSRAIMQMKIYSGYFVIDRDLCRRKHPPWGQLTELQMDNHDKLLPQNSAFIQVEKYSISCHKSVSVVSMCASRLHIEDLCQWLLKDKYRDEILIVCDCWWDSRTIARSTWEIWLTLNQPLGSSVVVFFLQAITLTPEYQVFSTHN